MTVDRIKKSSIIQKFAIFIATSDISFLKWSSTAIDGDSSIIFWFLLCIEHSLSPNDNVFPFESDIICISICRGFSMNFSKYTLSSLKDAFASDWAELKEFSNSNSEL